MKKISVIFAMLAFIVLGASCSKEERFGEGEPLAVSISCNLDGGLTKASDISKGKCVDMLYIAVYNSDMTSEYKGLRAAVPVTETGSGKFRTEMSLIKGEAYSFALWAQSSASTLYSFDGKSAAAFLSGDGDGLENITANYTDALTNNEDDDAFFATVTSVTITESTTVSAVLTRAGAQINFASSAKEVEAMTAGDQTFTPSEYTSAITVKGGLCRSFNVLTGTPGDQLSSGTLVAFGSSEMPSNKLTVQSTELPHLGFIYALVPQSGIAEEISIDIDKNGADLASLTVPNVPLKINHRTNIIGRILTGTSADSSTDGN